MEGYDVYSWGKRSCRDVTRYRGIVSKLTVE